MPVASRGSLRMLSFSGRVRFGSFQVVDGSLLPDDCVWDCDNGPMYRISAILITIEYLVGIRSENCCMLLLQQSYWYGNVIKTSQ